MTEKLQFLRRTLQFSTLLTRCQSYKKLNTQMIWLVPKMDRQQDIAKWNRYLSVFGLSSLILDGPHFVVSRNRAILSVFVNLLFIVLFCFQVLYSKFDNFNVAFMIMKGYLVFGSNLVSFLVVCSSLISSKENALLLNKFTRLTLSNQTSSISPTKLFVVIFILLFLSLSFDLTQFYFSKESKTMVVINVLSIHLSLLYILLHMYNFSVCLSWLKSSLNLLHSALISIKNRENVDVQSVIMEIRYWRKRFHDLVNLSDEINNIFAFRHLVIVGHNFIVGTLFAYGALSAIVTISIPINFEDMIELAVQLKWAALSFASIYGLIWPSGLTVKEATATVNSVYYVLSQQHPTAIRDELHKFALQFLNSEIKISPYGFFNLNNKLLLSITAALVSYLVILIQFQVSSFI